jgi:hypothetical protein
MSGGYRTSGQRCPTNAPTSEDDDEYRGYVPLAVGKP